MAQTKEKISRKVKLPVGRGNYCKLHKPETLKDGRTKYAMTLAIPIGEAYKGTKDGWKKDPQFAEAIATVAAVAKEKFGENWRQLESFKLPFRTWESYDDDQKAANPHYEGCIMIPATSYDIQPDCAVIENQKLVKTSDLAEFYSGAWFKVCVSPYAYKNEGKGVSMGLSSIVKVKDDTPLSTYNDVERDFDGDEDLAEYLNTDNADLFDGENPADMI